RPLLEPVLDQDAHGLALAYPKRRSRHGAVIGPDLGRRAIVASEGRRAGRRRDAIVAAGSRARGPGMQRSRQGKAATGPKQAAAGEWKTGIDSHASTLP